MNNHYGAKDLDFLLSPPAIRRSAQAIFNLTLEGKTHFDYHADQFDHVVDYVIEVINENYPTYDIPFHSRWGHFKVGGQDRVALLEKEMKGLEALERARVKFDLVITSVLLDAGAGHAWSYNEKSSGKNFNRSEGLGVASFYLFMSGALSGDGSKRATASGLRQLELSVLKDAFQVAEKNPLVGLEGRLSLLKNLGKAIEEKRELFPGGRPGNMVDYLKDRYGMTLEAPQILRAVLDGLGDIWPGRVKVAGVNLGDAWPYEKIEGGLAVFHKLSQWMTYSLIEPLVEAGLTIQGVDKLTGLAEYRNGGLLLDRGLITLKDAKWFEKAHRPDSELIVEWRGLTVALLDQLGMAIQKKLNKTPAELPLAKVLEGGTWWAGRKAARAKRPDGSPPLVIESDGTVF